MEINNLKEDDSWGRKVKGRGNGGIKIGGRMFAEKSWAIKNLGVAFTDVKVGCIMMEGKALL
jgi:hypothetical protein